MTGDGVRVEDTRTLQVGDPVRVVIESVVSSTDSTHLGVALDADVPGRAWWYLAHDVDLRPNVQVYRLPKPLPPEPPPGSEVLDAERNIWQRDDDDSAAYWRPVAPAEGEGLPWDVLLSVLGPVRLLDDPIEAPR